MSRAEGPGKGPDARKHEEVPQRDAHQASPCGSDLLFWLGRVLTAPNSPIRTGLTCCVAPFFHSRAARAGRCRDNTWRTSRSAPWIMTCLLYTSDAADEEDS